MDGVAAGDAHSVSAVAVIDLGEHGGRGSAGSSGHDAHGLLAGHSVVVIGGEEHVLLGDAHTPNDDDDDEDDDEEDDEDGGCGCGEDCGHDAPTHLIRVGGSPSSTASSTRGSSKRKRVVLSIHDKQQVLQRLEMGEQPVVISRDFGISRQQVSDIKKNRDRILAFCVDATHLSSLRRKTLKATTEYHPGVEQELYRWLIRQRKLGRGVSPDALAHKTTDLFMQYAADDAANVSFRSIHVWLRHFKRAHHIKTMDEAELARLPTKFTPAMDMAGASHADGSGGATSAGGETSATEGSAGRGSPTPSIIQDATTAQPPVPTPQPPAQAAADDVSSYMTNMDLAHHHATPPAPPHQPFLLQNHAPTIDMNSTHPFQMLMLSSASLVAATTTATMTPALSIAMPGQDVQDATSVLGQASPLQSCVQLAQKMNAELSRFEHAMAVKLETLDARVEKLCFSMLSTAGASSSHLHTTSSRFA